MPSQINDMGSPSKLKKCKIKPDMGWPKKLIKIKKQNRYGFTNKKYTKTYPDMGSSNFRFAPLSSC